MATPGPPPSSSFNKKAFLMVSALILAGVMGGVLYLTVLTNTDSNLRILETIAERTDEGIELTVPVAFDQAPAEGDPLFVMLFVRGHHFDEDLRFDWAFLSTHDDSEATNPQTPPTAGTQLTFRLPIPAEAFKVDVPLDGGNLGARVQVRWGGGQGAYGEVDLGQAIDDGGRATIQSAVLGRGTLGAGMVVTFTLDDFPEEADRRDLSIVIRSAVAFDEDAVLRWPVIAASDDDPDTVFNEDPPLGLPITVTAPFGHVLREQVDTLIGDNVSAWVRLEWAGHLRAHEFVSMRELYD
jgi:hypothetical protein